MPKQLMLVTATIRETRYMAEGSTSYDVTHLVWAEDNEEAARLIGDEYPTNEYAVYRYVENLTVSKVLGAPADFLSQGELQ